MASTYTDLSLWKDDGISEKQREADDKLWRNLSLWEDCVVLMCFYLRKVASTPEHMGPIDGETEQIVGLLTHLHRYGLVSINSQPHGKIRPRFDQNRGVCEIQQRGYITFLLPLKHPGVPERQLQSFLAALGDDSHLDVVTWSPKRWSGNLASMREVPLARLRCASTLDGLRKASWVECDNVAIDQEVCEEIWYRWREAMPGIDNFCLVHVFAKEWNTKVGPISQLLRIAQNTGLTPSFRIGSDPELREQADICHNQGVGGDLNDDIGGTGVV
ncbi:hypothetical protein BDZ85DRAFT_251728 [Elsinoe ampelina]|uniref:Uncharacterized protein n=1 Tax=Elsinoe ampelina TaxID=302913 RepID=A0A6A6G760_9PEZI|nr:hypothetical protein BDZ85DRAFT_251728 [Elsinoe ampelina]